MKTKIIWITSSTILFILAIIFWGIVDKVGDAVGETVADVVGTDLDNAKSLYYFSDEDLSELFSETTLLKNKGTRQTVDF